MDRLGCGKRRTSHHAQNKRIRGIMVFDVVDEHHTRQQESENLNVHDRRGLCSQHCSWMASTQIPLSRSTCRQPFLQGFLPSSLTKSMSTLCAIRKRVVSQCPPLLTRAKGVYPHCLLRASTSVTSLPSDSNSMAARCPTRSTHSVQRAWIGHQGPPLLPPSPPSLPPLPKLQGVWFQFTGHP